jgi:Dolichyl-phosphate-mannose-protein mannosyltransferase
MPWSLLRRLAGAWRALEHFAMGRQAAPSLVAVALLVYGIVSVALPLAPGRDFGRYALAYAQLFHERVVYPYAILSRPPGTPLVVGALLEGGPLVAEAGLAFLYALSIVAWFAVARRFGPTAAIVTAAALLLYPGFVLLFHRLSSDALFAAGFAFLAVLVVRTAERPSAGRAAALGAGVAGLILVRPVAQVLLLLVFLPLVGAVAWRGRLQGSAAFVLAVVVPLLAWSTHNALRADDFTVVRGGGATLPLFRAFVADRIVRVENGSASRELARAVASDLLPNEPYRSYEIDLEQFFSSGSARMHEDLTGLADRTWGWDDDYAQLARVGREAVIAHPWAYTRGVAGDVRDLLVGPLYAEMNNASTAASGGRVSVADRQLPVPTEGEPIPAARQSGYITTPDGRILDVWTSPTEHGLVFTDPADAVHSAEIGLTIDRILAGLPDRAARPDALDWLNRASRWYPRPVLWLILGVLAAVLRRPRGLAVPLVLAGSALLILLATSLAVYAVAEYSVPVTPAFILLACAAVLGKRAAPTE